MNQEQVSRQLFRHYVKDLYEKTKDEVLKKYIRTVSARHKINIDMAVDYRSYFRGKFLGLWNDDESVRTELDCPRCENTRLYSEVSYNDREEERKATGYDGPIPLLNCKSCDYQSNLRVFLEEKLEETISWDEINFNESLD